MSKAKNTLAAGVLVLALGASAAGISMQRGEGEPEPYRTVLPAPSPTVSVPAQAEPRKPVQDYVAVPAPTAETASPTTVPETEPAPDSSVSDVHGTAAETATAAGPEHLALAAAASWDSAQQLRVAAALASADAYTAAHPDTAETAVYASVRTDLACGTAEDGTALATRALRRAGYTFTGCGPEDIVGWFAAHPGSGSILEDVASARPGSLVLIRASSGEAVLGVYLGDGLAVFDGSDVCLGTAGSPSAATARPLVVPVAALQGAAEVPGPSFVRPAPFL